MMIIPELSNEDLDQLQSRAEVKVYKAIRDSCPKSYLVLFQVGWIASKETSGYTDGEIDFVICDPKRGFLVIEVKGGGISSNPETGKWFSTDRSGQEHSIKDPVKQSLNAKHAIYRKLKKFNKLSEFPFASSSSGHSVFFPDIKFNTSLIKPECEREMVGTAENLTNIGDWIERAFDFCSANNSRGPGPAGVELMKQTFGRPVSANALTSSNIDLAEKRVLELTSTQSSLLSFIKSRRRAIITGGAGTGKTVLAVDKAKELAADGYKTLVTCYNRPLADFLRLNLESEENISVLDVHQIAKRFIDAANAATKRDLIEEIRGTHRNADLWDVLMPIALWDSAEFVETRFDAIVCDEGQDIPEDFWMPLQRILTDFDSSPFFIFRDENQDIYKRTTSNVFEEIPFNLGINCRNTSEIHDYAYRNYHGPAVTAPNVSSIPVTNMTIRGLVEQSELITAQIRQMLVDPGISPSDIVVLVSSSENSSRMKAELAQKKISNSIKWTANHRQNPDEVLIETVKRFKGLEARIVILWLDDGGIVPIGGEELYVGASRARSQLLIISTMNALETKVG
jgi:hypothetical protein